MKKYTLNDVKIEIYKIKDKYKMEYNNNYYNINYIRCILNNIDIERLKEYVKLLKLCNCCKEHQKKFPTIYKYPKKNIVYNKTNKIKLNIYNKCDCFCRHEARAFVRAIILESAKKIEDIFYIFNIILSDYNNLDNHLDKNNYIDIIKKYIDKELGKRYIKILLTCNCCIEHKKILSNINKLKEKKNIRCVCPCRHYIRWLSKTFNL